MRPPALVSMLAVLVAVLIGATSCGGDDVFPRDQFVQQVTKGGVTKPVAECTYDNIKADKAIMADIVRADGPNDNITAKTDEKMARIIARCLLAVDGDTTTTTRKPSAKTTTTAKKR